MTQLLIVIGLWDRKQNWNQFETVFSATDEALKRFVSYFKFKLKLDLLDLLWDYVPFK